MADSINLKDYNFTDLQNYPNVGKNRKGELVEFSYNGNANLRPTGCKLALTNEAKEEYKKCEESFSYFVNTYVIVFVTGKGFVHIELRDYQYEIFDTIESNQKILLLAGRRLGKTTTVLLYFMWKMLFKKGFKCGFSANDDELRKASMDILSNIYQYLPPFLQSGVKKFNTKTIELENGSLIKSTVMSGNSFRGQGMDAILADEFSFSDKKEEFTDSVLPIISEAETVKFIITTTPNGMDGFYELWKKSEKGENNFVRLKLPWWKRKDRTQEWYDNEVKEHGEKYARQNHDCSFEGSSSTLISYSKIRELEKQVSEPIDKICDDIVDVYERLKDGYNYCIGVDTSKNSKTSAEDSDYISIHVLRIDIENYRMKQVAHCRTKAIHYTEVGDLLIELAGYYTNEEEPLILIENNSGDGQSIADNLVNNLEYENVFCETRRHDINGFRTTKSTKQIGLKNLKYLLEKDILKVNDFISINELKTFIKKGESYEAQEKSHDDSIMALVASIFWLQDDNEFEISMNDIKESISDNYEEEDREDLDDGHDFVVSSNFNENSNWLIN